MLRSVRGRGHLRLHCTETSTALRREKGVWMVGLRGPWSGPCGRRNRGIVGGRRGGPSACVRWQERGRGSTRALTVAARRFVGLRLGSPPRPRGRAAGSPIVRWGLKKRELKNSQRARLLTKKLAKGSAKAVLDQVGGSRQSRAPHRRQWHQAHFDEPPFRFSGGYSWENRPAPHQVGSPQTEESTLQSDRRFCVGIYRLFKKIQHEPSILTSLNGLTDEFCQTEILGQM